MCGIIGFIKTGNGMIRGLEKSIQELLVIDSIRGYDSTGIFCMAKGVKKEKMRAVIKDACDGIAFVADERWRKVMPVMQGMTFLVGHNRAATRGDVTAENAHPFKHGSVTMVHNGTLSDHNKLVDGEFDVDSDALCNYLSSKNRSAQDIFDDVNGAYAMVWEDRSNNTLNFMRNSQRPLWFGHVTDGVFFASEKAMLELVLGRNNIVVRKYEELDSMTKVSYNLDTFVKTEEKATLKSYYSGHDHYNSDYWHDINKSYSQKNNNDKVIVLSDKKSTWKSKSDSVKLTVPFTATSRLDVGASITFRYIDSTPLEKYPNIAAVEGMLHSKHPECQDVLVCAEASMTTLTHVIANKSLMIGCIKEIEEYGSNKIVTIGMSTMSGFTDGDWLEEQKKA